MHDYDQIYRRAHPRTMPLSPWEKQMNLRDLWPAEQEKFRRFVDLVKGSTDG